MNRIHREELYTKIIIQISMHPDIEKLINVAKESGGLTTKQREIIFKKAKAYGIDDDEIEFYLESAFSTSSIQGQSSRENRRKCPNCGAIIPDASLQCHECGFILEMENYASIMARKQIAELQDKLSHVSNYEKQATIINTFTIPSTKEGLLQLLELSYSNYAAIGTDEKDAKREPVRNAWRGKSLQAYHALERHSNTNSEIRDLLGHYKSLLDQEGKKKSAYSKKRKKDFWASYGAAIIVGALCFLVSGIVITLGIKSDSNVQDQIQMCIHNNDYQGAKSAAHKYSGDVTKLIDDISAQEVSYLISQGEIQQAKVVAASISDPEVRESVLASINKVE